MDYEKKYKIGDYVTAKEKPTNVRVEGEFCGYALADKSDPTSVVGHVLVKNDPRIHGKDNLYSVGIESIKLTESEDERIRKHIIDIIKDNAKSKCIPCDAEIAYLEKQKELNIELIQRSWYMEGYNDRDFRKEPRWIIKTDEDGPRYEDNPRYGLPLATKDKKEQKPADDKAFEGWIDDWWKHNKVNNPDSYDKGDEIQLDEKGFKSLCNLIRYFRCEEAQRFISDGGDKVAKAIQDNCKEMSEAEWGEEDTTMINSIIDTLRFYALITRGATEDVENKINWLDFLHKRLNL